MISMLPDRVRKRGSLNRIDPEFQKYLDFFGEKKSVGSFFGTGWLMSE